MAAQDSGSRRTVTRGAVLDGSDFSGQELAGISFQQSLCRDCKFVGTQFTCFTSTKVQILTQKLKPGSNLVGASFFDGDLTQVSLVYAALSY